MLILWECANWRRAEDGVVTQDSVRSPSYRFPTYAFSSVRLKLQWSTKYSMAYDEERRHDSWIGSTMLYVGAVLFRSWRRITACVRERGVEDGWRLHPTKVFFSRVLERVEAYRWDKTWGLYLIQRLWRVIGEIGWLTFLNCCGLTWSLHWCLQLVNLRLICPD